MKKAIAVALVTMSLVGCANNQGLGPEAGVDRHSGSKTVLMQPHGSDCKTMQCIAIGAFWTESAKDKALLTVSLLNTTDFIRDAYLEIDGVKVPLLDDGDLTSYERPYSNLPGVANSRKEYLVSLDVIRKLASAKKAWIFVQTGSGYMSDAIIDSQGDSKAFYAMQRFLSAIPK
ncbi:hypothetical protein ABQ397_24890 [Serratia fonticola]|uniref:hypothetical protein n=1 Tax=Serratia fonticola TaxID=47917 RepID=UPI003AAB146C